MPLSLPLYRCLRRCHTPHDIGYAEPPVAARTPIRCFALIFMPLCLFTRHAAASPLLFRFRFFAFDFLLIAY